MLIFVFAAIEPNDCPAATVQNLGPGGLRRGLGVAPEVEPLAGEQAVWIDVGVERLQFSDGESCLSRDLCVRVSGSYQPVRRHVP
jgi:hypothetical protein